MTRCGAMRASTSRYASYCSSSEGGSLRLTNKNSVRNRPLPSAPASSAASTSPGVPMFAARTIRAPSCVTAGRFFSVLRRACETCQSSIRRRYSASVASSGLTITSPLAPSIASVSPSRTFPRSACIPTTAGRPSARARIAMWPVGPPAAVTAPKALRSASSEISEGVMSRAATMPDAARASSPARFASSRRAMSSMSAARSRRYSSWSAWNSAMRLPAARPTACSAETPSPSMDILIASTSVGSSSMSRCT